MMKRFYFGYGFVFLPVLLYCWKFCPFVELGLIGDKGFKRKNKLVFFLLEFRIGFLVEGLVN